MAKIVYGVSGEGSGHSSRAAEVIAHLLARGHEVKAVSYDRGYRNLQGCCEVVETEGLHIVSRDNEVRPARTLIRNLRNSPKFLKRAREIEKICFDAFQPDCVFTDFEPVTAYRSLPSRQNRFYDLR